ncbi:hypothetical protein WG66_010681, partial [Moniliophthora roreri]
CREADIKLAGKASLRSCPGFLQRYLKNFAFIALKSIKLRLALLLELATGILIPYWEKKDQDWIIIATAPVVDLPGCLFGLGWVYIVQTSTPPVRWIKETPAPNSQHSTLNALLPKA